MHLAFGSDHIGIHLKQELMEYAKSLGHTAEDVGPYTEERTDYPIYGYRVGKIIQEGKADLGILICGTGVGISLAANKVKGIRAVVCSESYSADMARRHNDANILAMGARVVGSEVAKQIFDAFLSAEYEGGRHQRRVDMLSAIEQGLFHNGENT